MTDNQMTAEGYEALKAEVEQLENVERVRIADQIRVAREFGDLKENAEYHAAKEAASLLEARINSRRQRLAGAQIVEVTSGDVVGFGSTVELADPETGRELRYTIVSQSEAKPAQGLLSVESPVAAALIGRKPGDQARVQTPSGERVLKVVSVS